MTVLITPAAPPRPAGPAAVMDLRTDLAGAGYTVDGTSAIFDDVAAAALGREVRLPALLAARAASGAAGTPAAVLARLFLLGDDVSRDELDLALPRTRAAGAEALRLVRAAGTAGSDPVRAVVDLRPYAAADDAGAAQWWIASDLGELATGAALSPEHVLGIGGASTTLAQLTVREHHGRCLDVGTGCGVQALHAARHCDTVVATDLSGRALAFARFNADLAGVRLDLRRGSMLDPVRGLGAFDLVVSNPPFVITPRGSGLPTMTYRDGGRAGDDLVRDLVTGVGEHLAPGGVAQLLGNWEHRAGEGWADRVAVWLEESGLDGWVVQREVQDPAEYVGLWLRDGGLRPESDRAAYEAAYAAWLADLAARGVTGVGFGYVVLRRPEHGGRAPWHRVEEVLGTVRQPLGGHVAAVLAAQDRWGLGRAPGALSALAARRLAAAPDVVEERFGRPGAPDPQLLRLRQGGGFARVVEPGTLVAGAVGACDGELTVGQIVGGLAAVLDLAVAEVASEVLPALADLLVDGFLREV